MRRLLLLSLGFVCLVMMLGCQRDSTTSDGSAPADSQKKPGIEEGQGDGGLGDTPEQLTRCYGKATEKVDDPEFKGATRYTFTKDTLTVTAVVGGNVCGQITYAAKDGSKLPADRVEKLLQRNVVSGVSWQKLDLGTPTPRWMAKGQAPDGTRDSRMAMDLPEKLIIADLTFSEKYPRKMK